MRHDADTVIGGVTGAFAATPLPAPEALVNHHCCECAEVSAAYAGKRWTEISLDDVRAGGETALLTPAAWRYYLPAVMIWCVRAPQTADVILDNLVYQLEPPADGRGVPEWFNERAIGFSAAQRAAIAVFLSWCRDRLEEQWGEAAPPDDVDKALAYWTHGRILEGLSD